MQSLPVCVCLEERAGRSCMGYCTLMSTLFIFGTKNYYTFLKGHHLSCSTKFHEPHNFKIWVGTVLFGKERSSCCFDCFCFIVSHLSVYVFNEFQVFLYFNHPFYSKLKFKQNLISSQISHVLWILYIPLLFICAFNFAARYQSAFVKA